MLYASLCHLQRFAFVQLCLEQASLYDLAEIKGLSSFLQAR